MPQATRWLPTGAYEETRATPNTSWVPIPAAVTETQTADATFIAKQNKPILQAVNRASAY